MSNRGILRSNERWQYFKPLAHVAGTGSETQPVLNDIDGTTYQNGRWVRDPDTNYVTVQMQIVLVGTGATAGSGGPLLLRLPTPARRAIELDANRNCPIPLGTGMCYLSVIAPFVNVPVVPTLADRYASLGGNEDSWIQLYAPYVVSWGTLTGTGTGANQSVAHRAGFAVDARDVELVPTSTAQSSASGLFAVIATDSTNITVASRTAGSISASQTISWKVRAEPPTGQTGALVSPTTPFDWSRFTIFGPYPNLFVQLGYEAA